MPHALRHQCSRGLIVLSFMLIAPLLLAQGATVSGTIAVDATKIVPKVASAVTYTAPNGRLISVLLSDKPANPKEFAEMTKVGPTEPLVSGIIEGAWKSFHLEKQLSGFVFTIGNDRQIMSNEFLIGGADAFSVSDDELVLELKSTAPRVTGRIRTKAPTIELGDYKISLDVTFDVPVAALGK